MPNARDIVSFHTFSRLARVVADDDPASPAAGTRADMEILAQEVEPALSAWFRHLRSRGDLRPVPGSEGHESPFLTAWNGFARGEPPHPFETESSRIRTIVSAFETGGILRPYLMAGVGIGDLEPDAVEAHLQAAYAKFADALERGEVHVLLGPTETCASDGRRYRIRWSGWNPEMGTCESADGWRFSPIEPFETAPHRELEVTFETGELVVADWIRIPEFTKAVDLTGVLDEVGNVVGREAMTERYAREHGIVSVHVGGSGMSAYDRDGCLVFGRPDPDEDVSEGYLGTLEGNYRGVTVVDRSRLVSILAEGMGREAAESRVAEYLANPSCDALVLRVEPGRHHLYFSGKPHAFAETFEPADVDSGGLMPRMFLSPRPLQLEATQTVTPR